MLPDLHLAFTPREKHLPASLTLHGSADFPLFASNSREKLLLKIHLGVEGKITDRVIAGTALLVN